MDSFRYRVVKPHNKQPALALSLFALTGSEGGLWADPPLALPNMTRRSGTASFCADGPMPSAGVGPCLA